MLDKVLVILMASILFLIILIKIFRRNDANYLIILIIQAFGIAIAFFEIKLDLNENIFWTITRYLCSVIIPLLIIILEFKKFNFSEMLTIGKVKLLMAMGKYSKAKEILVSLVSKYPDSYLGHKYLAECYEHEGGMRRAIDEYVTAIDINKKDYKSYFKITQLLRELGKKDEAIEMLESLLKAKPDCYEASCLLGELLTEQERFKEAERVYQDALKFRPNDFDLYYNLGIIYTRLSDFQMAKEMYEMAANLNHVLWNAQYNLGLIAFIQGDYETAEKYFNLSVYGELEAKSYYQLAKIYMYQGEKDKAITFLNKAIELEPKLLEKVSKEYAFRKIRNMITVSVRDEEEVEDHSGKAFIDEEVEEEYSVDKKKVILEEEEKKATLYLEETCKLIEEMRLSAGEEDRIDERLAYLFNKEKENSEKKKEEIVQEIEKIRKERKELEELEKKQKELGNL